MDILLSALLLSSCSQGNTAPSGQKSGIKQSVLTLGKILFVLLLLFLCGVYESRLVDVGVVPPPVVDEHRDGVDHQEEEEAEYNYFLAVKYNWLPFPPTGTDLGTDTEL